MPKFRPIYGVIFGLFGLYLIFASPLSDADEQEDGIGMSSFIAPTYVMENREMFPATRKVKIGGIVKEGTVGHSRNTFLSTFVLTDLKHEIEVEYKGALPDLFAENSGAICEGFMIGPSKFKCLQIAAKHDARYMPQDLAAIVTKNKRLLDEQKLEEERKKYWKHMQDKQQVGGA